MHAVKNSKLLLPKDVHPTCASIVLAISTGQHLLKDWTVRVYHIYREANRVADYLAEIGHSVSFDSHTSNCPYRECTSLVRQDVVKSLFP